MHYFSYISYQLAFKNKLDAAVFEYLKENERQVIDQIDIEVFKGKIIAGISEINAKYPRCKPLKPTWWEHSTMDGDASLSGEGLGFVTFNLYKSKN